MKRIFIFIPGILSDPGDNFAWTDNACRWLDINIADARGEKFEYLSDAIFRRFMQDKRARELLLLVTFFRNHDYEVHLVGHSNGADVICRAVRMMRLPYRVASIALIAAACDECFDRNGLNDAVRLGKVGKIKVLCSKADKSLSGPATWSRMFSFLGLGYGRLGLVGPTRMSPDAKDVTQDLWFDNFDHSDYFARTNFNHVMTVVTGTEGPTFWSPPDEPRVSA